MPTNVQQKAFKSDGYFGYCIIKGYFQIRELWGKEALISIMDQNILQISQMLLLFTQKNPKKPLINAPIMFYLTSFPPVTMTTLFNGKRGLARGNAATRVPIPNLWTTRWGKCPGTLNQKSLLRQLGVSGLWQAHSGNWDSWGPGRRTWENEVGGVTCCRERMCFCRGRESSARKTGWELKRQVDAAGAQTDLYDH